MRIRPVLPNATLRAFIASGAKIHVEHENALSFVEALVDVAAKGVDLRIASKRPQRLLDQAPPKSRKQAHHFHEIVAAKPGQLQVVQRGTGRGPEAGGDRLGQIAIRVFERPRESAIDFGGGL
jgi:hypothetical protein